MKQSILLFVFTLMGVYANAQSFYDLGTIQTIEITFAQTNWDQLLDAEKAGNENYILAQSVAINGIVYDSVGVKYKGNSTYNPNQTKNPFHIELDTYKDHKHEEYTDIKLSNVAKDPSFVREVLSYQILRQYMDAPLSNYANVYVNGTLLGLYSNSESISKKFVKSRFGSKTNTFVKCNPPDGAGPGSSDYPNLVYLGTDSSNYEDAYELKSDYGWDELIDLCDTLNNRVTAIEAILDVDRALWMLAFNNILVNLDSYSGGFAQNYYLYRDDYNRFIPIVWDLNESFGQFSATGSGNLNSTTAKQQMTHLLHENDANYPLIQKLLSRPMYKKMYLAHCKTMLLENFDNGSYYTTGQSLQTAIDAAVQADVNKFYTYNNFISNLTTDVNSGGGPGGGGPGGASPGITNLMNARATYLLGLSDFTQTEPTISNVTASNSSPLVNDPVRISATIQDETTVYLGYRTTEGAPFERILMYDDGLHNDGAANDGVYGVDVTMTTLFMEYYIYAENNNMGKFSPVRAEYEYYSITAGTTVATDLVINEFLASNDNAVADQDGEFDDWIELYNNTGTAIDLTNYTLSDDGNDLTQWTFPSGSVIGANDYFVIWADNDVSQAGYHANFKLSASGESIYLVDPAGSIVDQITYTTQVTDTSYGRYANGTGVFRSLPPTFGSENMLTTSITTIGGETLELKAFPNPAQNYINLTISESEQTDRTVIVYDVYGRVVYETIMNQNHTIETSNWLSGVYIVFVEGASIKVIIE